MAGSPDHFRVAHGDGNGKRGDDQARDGVLRQIGRPIPRSWPQRSSPRPHFLIFSSPVSRSCSRASSGRRPWPFTPTQPSNTRRHLSADFRQSSHHGAPVFQKGEIVPDKCRDRSAYSNDIHAQDETTTTRPQQNRHGSPLAPYLRESPIAGAAPRNLNRQCNGLQPCSNCSAGDHTERFNRSNPLSRTDRGTTLALVRKSNRGAAEGRATEGREAEKRN
mgnify:CR=1 FL=1